MKTDKVLFRCGQCKQDFPTQQELILHIANCDAFPTYSIVDERQQGTLYDSNYD